MYFFVLPSHTNGFYIIDHGEDYSENLDGKTFGFIFFWNPKVCQK